MSVYVDDGRYPYGRMIMCHMLADTSAELHAMAERIGVARRWLQKGGTPEEHYDVSLTMRASAVALGAVEVRQREIVNVIRAKRAIVRAVPPTEAYHG
jgi:hypothetical protein